VTVALPFTAIEYAFAAFLAVVFLEEHVPPLRWAGIVLIIIGVIFIARGGGET
jgi:drug/metabolite transporter (DMT)-like permease